MDNINRLCAIWRGFARTTGFKAYVSEEDISSFSRRAGSEGPEYFARGLTALRADLLNGLETGQLVVRSRFGPKRGTILPRFMFGAWSAVFDNCGSLLPNVDTGAVICLNQLLAVFGKINGMHTPESERRVIAEFLACERELKATTIDEEILIANSRVKLGSVLDIASSLIKRVLSGCDPRHITPNHGSGASACGTHVHARYGVPRFIESINDLWPYDSHFYASLTHVCDVGMPTEEYAASAKVLLVPKDCKGPRLISCEPRETMFIQQGLMAKLYDAIESHPLTRGRVNFTRQEGNQVAAMLGSLNQSLATIDLKEASDRLRLDLVERLFPENWVKACKACRSATTTLPDGTVVELAKHAPMGSALCFPIMALSIWAVLTAALPHDRSVMVYGDDVIIESDHYDRAHSALELVGLRVNKSKSYVTGFFRESCGKEWYQGIDITPIRLRKIPDGSIASQVAIVEFSNNYWKQYDCEPCWLITYIREWYPMRYEIASGPFRTDKVVDVEESPTGLQYYHRYVHMPHPTGALCTYIPDNTHLRTRWNRDLQRAEVRVLMPESASKSYSTDNWSCVFRSLLKGEKKQLGRDALPKRVSYKYRWVAADV